MLRQQLQAAYAEVCPDGTLETPAKSNGHAAPGTAGNGAPGQATADIADGGGESDDRNGNGAHLDLCAQLVEEGANVTVIAATLRLVLAAIRDRDAAAREAGIEAGIEDAEIEALIRDLVDRRQAAIADHETEGRLDRVVREQEEIALLKSFLPKKCDHEEATRVCREAIEEVGATGLKDMGKTMDVVKTKLGPRMDFTTAKDIVRALLT